jgi:hypothetical protein
MKFSRSVVVIAASLLFCFATILVSPGMSWEQSAPNSVAGFQGVLTYHNDNLRTGQNLQETALTLDNVNSSSFGKLTSYQVDGMIFAQPLYLPNVKIPHRGVRNVVYVATENDSVYAFDADGLIAAPLWHHTFVDLKTGVTPIPSSNNGVDSVGSEIGITSTPVIDTSSGTIFVSAATKDKHGVFAQHIHALSLTTGADKCGAKLISASIHAQGDGSKNGVEPFSPVSQLQRSALLMDQGAVYLAFGSQGNSQPYHGWVFAYNGSGLGQAATFNDSPNGDGAGISVSGNGPAADSSGNVYIASGNGTFDAANGGTDYGQSLFELERVKSKFEVVDYFTPADAAAMATANLDFGSSGPMLLPDQQSGPPHLAIVGDAEGSIYVLNRDNLGHFNSGGDQIVQELPTEFGGGIFSAPAYFNGQVYFGSSGNPLVAFPLQAGQLNTDAGVSLSTHTFSFPGTTPAISADGSNNGIVWAIDTGGYNTNGPAILYAFDAASLNELYDSTQAGSRDTAGAAVEYSVPVIANGKVYIGTQSELDIYGQM